MNSVEKCTKPGDFDWKPHPRDPFIEIARFNGNNWNRRKHIDTRARAAKEVLPYRWRKGRCVVCGDEFRAPNHRKHCSRACTAKAYRARKKAGLTNPLNVGIYQPTDLDA